MLFWTLLASCSLWEAPPPSVLLITLDTTRADRLGPYGYEYAQTPTYDRFAEQGTLFERAYATCPLTIPSHSTILTGRNPPSHGVRDNGEFILGQEQILLSERFQAAGYLTAAFTSAFPTQARWGFDQGFDAYHDPLKRLPTQLDWRDERQAEEVVTDAIETLKALRRGDEPMFVWVHLFDAHWPYAPPEPYRSQHMDPYDGEVAYASDQVGRLLAWWDAVAPGNVTLITADHGEGFGDGGEKTHGFLLHDGTIRVPMMLRGPGVEAGARIDDPVGHVDIAPTLLRLAGLEPHPEIQGKDLREGGSSVMYSEALTGQFNLGLAPLYSWTDREGRFTEGSWAGFYPVEDHAINTRYDPDHDTTEDEARLGRLRATLDEVIAPEAALDTESLEMLMALGYIGGDRTAEAGEIDPRDVIDLIPYTWQARQAISAGRFGAADRLIQELEFGMPETFGVDLLRAQLLSAQGALFEAHARYVDLFSRSPTSTVALQVARLSATMGDPSDAWSWYREALALQPASPEAMSGLVRALLAMGEGTRAQDLAERYLAIYPDHAELALMNAELLLAEGRSREALVEANFAASRLSFQPHAHQTRARAYWSLGAPDPAIAALKESLRIDPYDLSARMMLTEWFLDVGRNAEAVRTIAPVSRLLPEDPGIAELAARAKAALEQERGEPTTRVSQGAPPTR